MSEIFKLMHPINVTLDEPTVIKYYESGNTTPKYAELKKEALKFIYDTSLKIPSNISSKLYELSPDLWRELIQLKMSQNTDFDLNNFTYVMHDTFVFALTAVDLHDSIDKFEALNNSFGGTVARNVYDVLQMSWESPNYDITEYTPVMLFDLDFDGGKYKMYSGVIRDNRYIIMATPTLEESSFELFISKNFDYEMDMTKKLADNVNSRYVSSKAQNLRLSVREVIEVLKKSKVKVNVDDDGLVESFDGINDSDSLLSFFDEFNMTYKSLTKLPLLRKSVKADGLVIDELLRVLSGDLFTFNNNIRAEIIASVLRIYYTEESDILIINDIIQNSNK